MAIFLFRNTCTFFRPLHRQTDGAGICTTCFGGAKMEAGATAGHQKYKL